MIANLHISVMLKGQGSLLQDVFFTPPFKVMNITEDRRGKVLQLMLMSSSPGIFDGDVYELKIDIKENAALHLHTQAYQRIFDMKQEAKQMMQVYIEAGASFTYLPHPSVPHERSAFTGLNQFYLQQSSALFFGEVLTCGRKLNGEIFRFTKYHSITDVYVEGKLLIKENLLIEPAVNDPMLLGQLEGFTHQASLICIHPSMDIEIATAIALSILQEEPGMEYGITAAPVNGILVRLLGNGAEQLHTIMQRIVTLLHKSFSYPGSSLPTSRTA